MSSPEARSELADQITEEAVREVLKSVLGSKLRQETRLIADGVIGSLTLVDVIVALERRFGIVIDISDVESPDFDSVERITRVVQCARQCARLSP